jgi:hypothetical protein
MRGRKRSRRRSQAEVDRIVVSQADDPRSWGKAIKVQPKSRRRRHSKTVTPSPASAPTVTTSQPEEVARKDYEQRLQRRLRILREQFEAGKVQIAAGLQVIESLKAVQYASDGSVDLNTVDGLVRAMALGVEAMHDREELKNSISLSDIQSTYFTFLERNFGSFYRLMRERGMTPHAVGMALSSTSSSVEQLTRSLPEFLAFIKDFWAHAADAGTAHVEDMQGTLKGVFGGDLFPSHGESLASKCGIYLDTVILPDPFMRSLELFERWKPDKQAYYLVKHGLNLLQYRELACAAVEPPIAVVLPDRTAMDERSRERIASLARDDAVVHSARVFGRQFESFDSLLVFCRRLESIDQLLSEVVEPGRVLFNTDWEGSLGEQLKRAASDQHAELLGTSNPGLLVASEVVGRMGVSNELLEKARSLGGVPIIDAPTSWQYFVWKLEYDARAAERETRLPHLHVARGLQALAENQMEWLGRVPHDALVEIRKAGAVEEIRALLGRGIEELALAGPTDFEATANRVLENIQAAFEDHRRKVAELTRRKWKFAGSDIGSWLVVGSLAVTAAATGRPAWGLAAVAADQLLDAPKLREIPASIEELARETEKLKRSPIGLLFKYSGYGKRT